MVGREGEVGEKREDCTREANIKKARGGGGKRAQTIAEPAPWDAGGTQARSARTAVGWAGCWRDVPQELPRPVHTAEHPGHAPLCSAARLPDLSSLLPLRPSLVQSPPRRPPYPPRLRLRSPSPTPRSPAQPTPTRGRRPPPPSPSPRSTPASPPALPPLRRFRPLGARRRIPRGAPLSARRATPPAGQKQKPKENARSRQSHAPDMLRMLSLWSMRARICAGERRDGSREGRRRGHRGERGGTDARARSTAPRDAQGQQVNGTDLVDRELQSGRREARVSARSAVSRGWR